jgi:peptide-methionine (S)-S-oxide reductase
MRTRTILLLLLVVVAAAATSNSNIFRQLWPQPNTDNKEIPMAETDQTAPANRELATFGTGCFWCTEAVFQQLKGVEKVVSGYTGGKLPNPTYEDICTGLTGHAEVIQITFDPAVITFSELLEAFWYSHDPTTLNRQGNDVGTQYRSAVFYHNDVQRREAEHYKKQLDDSAAYSSPIVTEITAATTFYPAEQYHQNYYNDNPRQGYCSYIIRPKLEKFREAFAEKLK